MTNRRRLIEFFLYPDALGLDIVGPLDVFTITTEILKASGNGDKGYRSVFSAEKAGPVRLNSGLHLVAEMAIGEGPQPDMIIFPGGKDPRQVALNQELAHRIRLRANKAKKVVSVCNGAFILAACGLLNQKKVTTHWLEADNLAQLFPDVHVHPDSIYIRDGNILTSAGVTAGIDLAVSVVEDDHGPIIAMKVARMLVLYLRRSGGQSQFSEPMRLRAKAGNQYIKLHDWISSHIEQRLSVDDLAEYAGMSPRNFSRVFTKTTGVPPGRYVELMRLNKARELLESSDASFGEVARASGFCQEERMRRAFVRHLGILPSQYRVHFKMN